MINYFLKTILFSLAISFACISKQGYAQQPTNDVSKQIAKIENYFEKLQTMQANFVQLNQDGSIYQGKFYLLRPNKFRLDYTDPSSLLVLSDGNSLINFDKDVGDPGYLSLDSTPAHFILRKHVKLTGDITVSSLLPGLNSLRATLVKTNDSQMGSLTLVFQADPFMLKGWIVLDSQETITQVVLSEISENVPLDPKLFRFNRRRH